ncbi:hypothetical protein ACFX1X_037904 [Malus domestica]|uniref:14-3-3 domain-containing protein n=1 Tax=Malus domestica TaxID=3750 RepID=A0A498JN59_MALDO|nr:hypothetical protein DVH24_035648 [Malus domestica]
MAHLFRDVSSLGQSKRGITAPTTTTATALPAKPLSIPTKSISTMGTDLSSPLGQLSAQLSNSDLRLTTHEIYVAACCISTGNALTFTPSSADSSTQHANSPNDSPALQRSLTSTAASKMKKASGLKSPGSGSKKSPGSAGSGVGSGLGKPRWAMMVGFLLLSSPAPMASIVLENLSREQYVYLAKLAEQVERYEEMVSFMEKLVVDSIAAGTELTVEEHNLLSVAYKNVIGSLHAAWRIISSIEQKEECRRNEDHVALVKQYRSKVETELSAIYVGILELLRSHLVPSATTGESKVFYLKMKDDYHRYLARFKSGDERKTAA